MSDYTAIRFNLITSLLSVLNRSEAGSPEHILAEYMLQNLKELDSMSIYTIADQCFLSRSTVQRFIKLVGYDSFTALKSSLPELREHQRAFIAYADHTNYPVYLMQELFAMIVDINHAYENHELAELARLVHDGRRVLIVTAEDSSSAARDLQQALLSADRLINLFTSSSASTIAIERLEADDLVIACSVTGNYALSINSMMRGIAAQKVLITDNHSMVFEETYDHIYYLGEHNQNSQRNLAARRDIYTSYAMQFFLDLLFNEYARIYSGDLQG